MALLPHNHRCTINVKSTHPKSHYYSRGLTRQGCSLEDGQAKRLPSPSAMEPVQRHANAHGCPCKWVRGPVISFVFLGHFLSKCLTDLLDFIHLYHTVWVDTSITLGQIQHTYSSVIRQPRECITMTLNYSFKHCLIIGLIRITTYTLYSSMTVKWSGCSCGHFQSDAVKDRNADSISEAIKSIYGQRRYCRAFPCCRSVWMFVWPEI